MFREACGLMPIARFLRESSASDATLSTEMKLAAW